ncbi:hypothetical protein [Burkholderia territorii]|uniref:hypothetical protein n=1 Tax=Burkholderia territorii TaxID=1503055 RepID=UPI00075788EE|nr:hypothetical protein [Burkholderia territorii]
MQNFNDEMRKKILDEFGNIDGVTGGNKAVDAILKEALAHPGFQAKCNTDYTRTYTEADYTRYDRTQSGRGMIDLPNDFDAQKIQKIIQGIEE